MTDDGLMGRVREATLEAPGSRKIIAEFLVREGGGISNLSMSEVADLTFTSKPSLVRFAKAMGFGGWSSFRKAFVTAVREREAASTRAVTVDPNHPFGPGEDLGRVVQSVAQLEQHAIAEVMSALDVSMLAEATRRVLAARTLVFFGARPNCNYGRVFACKMCQIGKRCLVPDEHGWTQAASSLGPGDCAIIASYSGVGEQRPPVCLAEPLNEAGVSLVAITNSGSNWLREHCDCALSYAPRERYYSKISGFYSEQCVSFMLDALFSACFASDYEGNEIRRLHARILAERSRVHHVDDMLPT